MAKCKPRQISGNEPFNVIKIDYNRYCGQIFGNGDALFLQLETIAFVKRVVADGGLVEDIAFLNRFIVDAKNNDYYDDLAFTHNPEWGIKVETGTSKLYSITGAAFDITQPVAGLQSVVIPADLNGKDRLLFDGVRFIGNTLLVWPAGIRTVGLMGFAQHSWTNSDRIFSANNSTSLQQKGVTPDLRLISNTNDLAFIEPNAVLNGDFHFSSLFNAASSSTKVDDNAESTGDAGSAADNGFALGADPSGGAPGNFSIGGSVAFVFAVIDAAYTVKMQAFKNFSAAEYSTNCESVCASTWDNKDVIWVGTSIPAVGAIPYPINTGVQIGANMTNEAVSSSHIGLVELDPLATAARSLAATQAQIIAHPKYVIGEEVNSYEVKIIGANADLLVIDHGHNDTDIPSGDIDSVDIATFNGGMNVVIQAAMADNPLMDIVLLTPPKKWFAFGESADILRIRDDIFALGSKYNKSVIDLTNLCGFTEDNYLTYFPDDVHPNEAGRLRIANIISNRINDIIQI